MVKKANANSGANKNPMSSLSEGGEMGKDGLGLPGSGGKSPRAEFRALGEESAGHDHAHMALIYETRDELFATVFPFLRAGLEQGERCMYVVSETPKAAVLEAMDMSDFDFKAALEAGDLSLHSADEAYLQDGEFEPGANDQLPGESHYAGD